MDAFRLQCFVALAEELNFHRAAARCHISQPAMSQQIVKLEDELGVQLAARTKRSVSLTRAGEVFLREARKSLRQLELAVALAQRTNRGELGQVTIGITAPALYIAFPEIAHAFAGRLPKIGLVVHEMTTFEQERALRDGTIDAGILHPPLEDADLAFQTIAEPPFAVVLPATHRLAARPEITLKELAGEDFILFPRDIGPQLHDSIISLCRDAGFSPRIAHEAHPAQSIIALAAAGMGVGFIASTVQRLERPGAVYVPIKGPRPRLGLGIAFRPGSLETPVVAAFVDVAKQAGTAIR
ncbi:LysR family transcriptional regulator [Actinophytocola sp.]|uniref:LysR family transcriptional regulator n=1 Tax=Actinophytocola sp. TaxID=1872138 RepID=UPI003D6BC587